MQSRIFRNGLFALLVLGFAACGDNSHQHTEATGQTAAPAEPAPAAVSVSLKDSKLDALYKSYIDLKSALVTGDATAAANAAKAIQSAGESMDNGKEVAALAARLSASADLKEQRTFFGEISTLMIAMVKQSGLSSGKVYVEYCPMAFDNKGASWLSNEEAIKNPYFGDEMLTCGEVTETLQ